MGIKIALSDPDGFFVVLFCFSIREYNFLLVNKIYVKK
jgi:hypothetical protein